MPQKSMVNKNYQPLFVAKHTCALITLLKDRGQCRTSPRSKQVLNGLQHRELEMLPLPQGSGIKTHKYTYICKVSVQTSQYCFAFLENLCCTK